MEKEDKAIGLALATFGVIVAWVVIPVLEWMIGALRFHDSTGLSVLITVTIVLCFAGYFMVCTLYDFFLSKLEEGEDDDR